MILFDNCSYLSESDLSKMGFLPSGLFERLVCQSIGWCHQTSVISFREQSLFKDMVILTFGNQKLRLKLSSHSNSVELCISGASPLAVHNRICSQLSNCLMEESIRDNLQFDTLIPLNKPINPHEKLPTQSHPSSSSSAIVTEELCYISLKKIRSAELHKQVIFGENHSTLLTPDEIILNYSAWLERKLLLSSYDIFMSYRWGKEDSELVSSLFEMFKKYPVGTRGRDIRVFLDDQRLQPGQDFQLSFGKSLINSSVMTPIISEETLKRMKSDACSPATDPEDNVLVEWIIGLNCSLNNNLHIFPIITFDIWADKMKIIESIPNEIHETSLKRASELLSENRIVLHSTIASLTMRDILNKMVKFLGCKLIDPKYNQHKEKKICEQIISIVNNIIISHDEEQEQEQVHDLDQQVIRLDDNLFVILVILFDVSFKKRLIVYYFLTY